MKFGPIESIQIHDSYAFVQFECQNAANAALVTPRPMIKKRTITVKAADPSLQPDHPFNKPPEQDSTAHILIALNNDCLREVFKRLELNDLTNVAETCVRFHQQANEAFRSKYKHFVLHMKGREQDYRLLNNFCSVIQSLDVSRLRFTTLQMINRECTQLNALTLRFVKCNWTDVRLLFPRLEILKLRFCEFNEFSVDSISKLKHLEVIHCRVGSMDERNSKQYHYDTFTRWFTMCPMLENLSIVNSYVTSTFDSRIIRWIGENLPGFQSVEFDEVIDELDNFQNDVRSIANLKSLKVLKLFFNYLSIAPLAQALAANNVPIEQFTIKRGKIDSDGIESVAQLKQLEVLWLYQCENWSGDHLISLAKELPKLHELRLIDWRYRGRIDMNHYQAILEAVQNRPDKKKLVIVIPIKEATRVNVPANILYANHKMFHIQYFK